MDGGALVLGLFLALSNLSRRYSGIADFELLRAGSVSWTPLSGDPE